MFFPDGKICHIITQLVTSNVHPIYSSIPKVNYQSGSAGSKHQALPFKILPGDAGAVEQLGCPASFEPVYDPSFHPFGALSSWFVTVFVIRAHSASLILSSHSNCDKQLQSKVFAISQEPFERVKATYLHPLQYRLHAVRVENRMDEGRNGVSVPSFKNVVQAALHFVRVLFMASPRVQIPLDLYKAHSYLVPVVSIMSPAHFD